MSGFSRLPELIESGKAGAVTARTFRIAAAIALASAALALAPVAVGQQRAPQTGPSSRIFSGPQSQAPVLPAQGAAQSGDSQLLQRVDQLEGQLVDLQVIVGTLESFARSGGGGATPGSVSSGPLGPAGAGGQDSGRIEALETQVRALSSQIEQMSQHIRALEASLGSAPGPVPGPAFDPRSAKPDLDGSPGPGSSGFGSTTVTPGAPDDIGRLLGPDQGRGQDQFAELDLGGGNPKQAYERAYGLLLQQNYAAAEQGFQDFLKRYPGEELAANAQYWLGETFFVRGLYKDAAGAFLKGSRAYSKSAKGPDSMLKLAMSLDRLGQRDAACQAYSELSARYPNPPQHVRDRAKSERQRVGCR